jgi:predicted Zn-ribbon and HTH transcriptional regulator
MEVERNSTDESPVADTSILMSSDGTDEEMLSTVIEKVFLWLSSNGADRRITDIDISRDRFDILSYLKGPVKNSVHEVSRELANEWDYGKNGNLKPDMIASGSSQTVNWICSKCGYRWATRIYQRTKNHTGCPKCAGQVFEKGINDLETKNPELLVDWDYEKNMVENIIPCEIQYNSGKRVNWKCHKCGYRWESPLNTRTVQGNG